MVTYDKYYKKANYFGNPYKELLDFFKDYPNKSSLCDLGSGQGRDSISLSKMGYQVTGVDISTVGIEEMIKLHPSIKGFVADIYTYDISFFDIVLMDSMLHFYSKDLSKEKKLVEKICIQLKNGGIFANCLLKSAKNEKILKETILNTNINFEIIHEKYIDYPDFNATYHFLVIKKNS